MAILFFFFRMLEVFFLDRRACSTRRGEVVTQVEEQFQRRNTIQKKKRPKKCQRAIPRAGDSFLPRKRDVITKANPGRSIVIALEWSKCRLHPQLITICTDFAENAQFHRIDVIFGKFLVENDRGRVSCSMDAK